MVAQVWIPISIFAALAQTVRNATQRHLYAELGMLGATLVRFLYGLPFAVAWLVAVRFATALPIPSIGLDFIGWALLGSLSQIVGTALLLRTMAMRNFAVGVAYSKTEVVQVPVFSAVLLGDLLDWRGAAAVACATLGLLLLTPASRERPIRALIEGFTSPSALCGLACGACMAIAGVAFRGATLAAHSSSFLLDAALALAVGQLMQTVMLGGWLCLRDRATARKTLGAWRSSLFAGFMGATASAGWFTAFALKSAAYVRTVGLIEMVFTYLVSRIFFREQLTPREVKGMALITFGVVLIATAR